MGIEAVAPQHWELPELPDLDMSQTQAHQQQVARTLGIDVRFRDPMQASGPAPEMVVIPPGLFEMGSSEAEFGHHADEGPVRVVPMRQPYALGRSTITAAEFARFQMASGFQFRSDLITTRGEQPVINIRRNEAEAYARWLSEQTGQRYRLPSEIEWEYACRAGTVSAFCFGDSVSCREVNFNPTFPYEEQRQKRKWYLPRCMPMSLPEEVAQKPANAWGLHDMHGNVWEFTADNWNDKHSAQSIRVQRIVVKGGSYFDSATLARSAARRPRVVDELDVNLGFRLLRELVD
jgi:formylglycine-generating enzyme required for sulfatase activity